MLQICYGRQKDRKPMMQTPLSAYPSFKLVNELGIEVTFHSFTTCSFVVHKAKCKIKKKGVQSQQAVSHISL